MRVLVFMLGLWVLSACNVVTVDQPTATLDSSSSTSTPAPAASLTSESLRIPLVITPFIEASAPFTCPTAPQTRLILQERAHVMNDDPRALNVRAGPGTSWRVLRRIEPEAVFFVLDGPICSGDYVWYKIRYEGLEGWIAEGDFKAYYVEPYLSG